MRAPNRLKFWKHYSLGGHFGSFSALRFYGTLPSHLGREGLWFLGVFSVELTRAKSASAGRRALAWRPSTDLLNNRSSMFFGLRRGDSGPET